MYLQEKKQKISESFERKLSLLKDKLAEDIRQKVLDQKEDVGLALKYLYASSPLSDIGNFSFKTYFDFASHGLYLRGHSEYMKRIPGEIFYHYVMHHRVNEEEIEVCRSFFFTELKEKVRGLSMKEAALAVNLWCAGEAAYQCSDDRTVSAMTVYRTARGRCGEESTFTVNAMRSVGIPARQIYAPRWSHCDDNHAWVEVWCDGEWYFLGACEPEAVLNIGWFVGASSRAILIHSRWFEPFGVPEKEEVVGNSGMVTLLNQTPRYAATEKISVAVKDEAGFPVCGAAVRIEVLNYAELFPVTELITDADGMAKVTLGLGSIVIEVVKDGRYAAAVFDVREEKTCSLMLREGGYQYFWDNGGEWKAFDFYAPKDNPLHHNRVSKEQRERIKVQTAEMNSHRLSKENVKNEIQIERFLDTWEHSGRKIAVQKFVSGRKEKDLLDGKAYIWQEHLEHALVFLENYPEDIFYRHVAEPRVYLEVMKAWRMGLAKAFSEEEKQRFRKNPFRLWEWISEHIAEYQQEEYQNLITTPEACIRMGIASTLSKKILFVAVLRTLGIAARLHPWDVTPEYDKEGSFVPVTEMDRKRESAVLCLGREQGEVWNYLQNFTLGRWDGSRFETMQIADVEFASDGMKLSLKPGIYRLLTTNRLPNGNSFAAARTLSLKEGEQKNLKLYLRSAELTDMLEKIELPDFELVTMSEDKVRGSEISGKGWSIYFFLEEGREPTEHILNELMERKEAYQVCGAKLVFVVSGWEALQQVTLKKCLKELPGIQVYAGEFEELIPVLARGMYVDPEKLPLMMVTRDGLNGVYGTCGYNVGTGDMLLKILGA